MSAEQEIFACEFLLITCDSPLVTASSNFRPEEPQS